MCVNERGGVEISRQLQTSLQILGIVYPNDYKECVLLACVLGEKDPSVFGAVLKNACFLIPHCS